jgi:hypothetical protein
MNSNLNLNEYSKSKLEKEITLLEKSIKKNQNFITDFNLIYKEKEKELIQQQEYMVKLKQLKNQIY